MNSAPIRDPRRHVTRQRLPDPADLDKRRRKIPATESVPSMTICTPVSERSTTVQGRTANPSSNRIQAFEGKFLRGEFRSSFRFRAEPKWDAGALASVAIAFSDDRSRRPPSIDGQVDTRHVPDKRTVPIIGLFQTSREAAGV
jgi:hypothetical protein